MLNSTTLLGVLRFLSILYCKIACGVSLILGLVECWLVHYGSAHDNGIGSFGE